MRKPTFNRRKSPDEKLLGSVLRALDEIEIPKGASPAALNLVIGWRQFLVVVIAADSHTEAMNQMNSQLLDARDDVIDSLGICGVIDAATGFPCARKAAPTGDRCLEHSTAEGAA